MSLSSEALFFIGFFSIIAGYLLYRLFTLKTFKARYSKIQKIMIALVSVIICTTIAMLSFDSRTVKVMLESPQKLSQAGIRYCPKPLTEITATNKDIKIKPGCELMYKAFTLGLTKTLGTCAPDKEESAEFCTLRQYDEPLLHYSARLFIDFILKAKEKLEAPDLKETIKYTFERQLQHTDVLIGKLKHVVKSAPKASHHIYTNLPYPNGALKYYQDKWLKPKECFNQFQRISHLDKAPSMSKVFENVYGQLLFNSQHSSAVGSCLEYTIHWNSPPDTCQKLIQNPQEFLKSNDLLSEVKTVLSRLDEQKGFHTLQYQLIFLPFMQFSRPVPPTAAEIEKVIPKVGQDLRADQVISFQCFMQANTADEATDKVQQRTLAILGHSIEVREVKFVPPPQSDRVYVGMYKLLSQLLARDFNYAGYLSNARESVSNVLSTSSVGPEAYSLNAYPLSSLEYLKGVDIFLGHDWLQSREDLLEVYPYYYHLYNFIDVFRKQYHLQRTRL